jgi:acetyl-CoA carboxylase biotin carboxylase subunit
VGALDGVVTSAVRVLVANRGEIAVRIMRACRELGYSTVAVYSNSDRMAPHVRYADQAVALDADIPEDTYLHIPKLIDAARKTQADMVHPGYGFLAENAEFASACGDAGLRFVGPSPEVITLMGGKTAARQAAKKAGVPVVPGTESALDSSLSDAEVLTIAEAVGYPLFVKAVSGGGGKGMRLVQGPSMLVGAMRAARSEAQGAFGDSAIYLERSINPARHIEVQLIADAEGHVVPFVERECSVQRRHQKVIEETPSPAVTVETRRSLAAAARALAQGVGYVNAGTVEFLLDEDERFYFLEMNTRLQVEHPITEMVTGVDLVHWQLRIASGERLTLDPGRALEPRGHALECRIYAEDPESGFMPSPGRITRLCRPAGPGIRDDSGVDEGFEVPVFYDSMISKLVAWAPDRGQVIQRMIRALGEYHIEGVKTTLPFFLWMLRKPEFLEGRVDTGFLDRLLASKDQVMSVAPSAEVKEHAVLVAAVHTFFASQCGVELSQSVDTGAWRRAGRLEGLR